MATDLVVLDARRINLRRVQRGLLKGELARAAGLSIKTLSRAFSGCPVGVRAARQIASAVGLSVDTIIVETRSTVDDAEPAAARAS